MKVKEFDIIISVILLVCLVIVAFMQVLFRFVLNLPLAWSEELSRFLYIFMINLATSVAIKTRSMIKIEILELFLNKKALKIIDKVSETACFAFTLFVAIYCYIPIKHALRVNQLSPALGVPVALLYSIMMVLYLLMSVRYFMQIFNLQKSESETY